MPTAAWSLRLHRQSLPLRRPGHLGSAVHLFVPPRRHQRHHRQLLAGAGAGQGSRAREARRDALLRRSDPHGRVAGRRAVDVGDVPRSTWSALDQQLGVNVGAFDRPLGGAALRHGRSLLRSEAAPRSSSTSCGGVVREALEAGALGLSITRNMSHFDVNGVPHSRRLRARSRAVRAGRRAARGRHRRDPVRRRDQPRAEGRPAEPALRRPAAGP